MTVTLTVGERQRRAGTYQAKEDMTQSTATSFQALSITTDVSTLSGGTATGAGLDLYSLADGVEGQMKTVVMLATGEAKALLTNGTATGQQVFTAAGDFMDVRFINEAWHIIVSSATLATST